MGKAAIFPVFAVLKAVRIESAKFSLVLFRVVKLFNSVMRKLTGVPVATDYLFAFTAEIETVVSNTTFVAEGVIIHTQLRIMLMRNLTRFHLKQIQIQMLHTQLPSFIRNS